MRTHRGPLTTTWTAVSAGKSFLGLTLEAFRGTSRNQLQPQTREQGGSHIPVSWRLEGAFDVVPPGHIRVRGPGAGRTFGVMLWVMQKARCCRMLSMLW